MLTQHVAKFIPGLQSIFNLTRKSFFSDILAGVVVALILIPQAIAYAQLAGLAPQQGLYAALVAPIVAVLFGSSTKLSTGPVAIVSLITASAFSTIGVMDTDQIVSYGILLAILVGLIQLIFGFLRMGVIVNFISHPVMIGFSNAAALIIATSQLPKVFGIKIDNYDHHYQTMYHFILALPSSVHSMSLLFALSAIALIIVIKKIHPMTPGVLFVMMLSICASWFIKFEDYGGSVVGSIPPGLPQLSFIDIGVEDSATLFSTAVIIAILGFMESVSVAKSLAIKSGEKINASQEFIGQGLANIASGIAQGYPVAGSFSRSAVNYSAGAVTGFSSIVASTCVLVALVFLTPLLYHLPQSVLSSIIIASVLNLINFKKIIDIYKIMRSDGIIATVTFFATIFYAPHLDQGIFIGIILSTAYFIYRRTNPKIVQLTVNKLGKIVEIHSSRQSACKHIVMLRFDGSLFFANTAFLESYILSLVSSRSKSVKYIILDAQGVNYIDSSGVEMLERFHKELREIGINLVFVRLKEELIDTLKKTSLYRIVRRGLFDSRSQAIKNLYDEAHLKSDEENCCFKMIR